MHRITLMRHGPPDVSRDVRLALRDMDRWTADYNAAGVSQDAPIVATAAAEGATEIFCSTLPRAVDSLSRLGFAAPKPDAVFTELFLPAAPDIGLIAPASRWLVMLRLAWLAGYAKDCESLAEARARTDRAAGILADAAARGPTLLMAHGGTNRMIASAFRKRGWRIEATSPGGFWSHAVLRPPKPENAA